jgi:hypothetical protein
MGGEKRMIENEDVLARDRDRILSPILYNSRIIISKF